jgi:hypothetical protein
MGPILQARNSYNHKIDLTPPRFARKAEWRKSWLIDWWNSYAYVLWSSPLVTSVLSASRTTRKRMEQASELLLWLQVPRFKHHRQNIGPRNYKSSILCTRSVTDTCLILAEFAPIFIRHDYLNTHVITEKNRFYRLETTYKDSRKDWTWSPAEYVFFWSTHLNSPFRQLSKLFKCG